MLAYILFSKVKVIKDLTTMFCMHLEQLSPKHVVLTSGTKFRKLIFLRNIRISFRKTSKLYEKKINDLTKKSDPEI